MSRPININRFKPIGIAVLFSLLSACFGDSLDEAIPVSKPRSEIQSEVQLLQPINSATYSRLYAYGDYFFATVDDEGIQVIDNSNPESPLPVNFISIVGAKDVVINGDTLITNQYADLVILSISQQQEVARINDLYDYKDYLDIPSNAYWVDANILSDNVVVGFEIKEGGDDDFCLFFCF